MDGDKRRLFADAHNNNTESNPPPSGEEKEERVKPTCTPVYGSADKENRCGGEDGGLQLYTVTCNYSQQLRVYVQSQCADRSGRLHIVSVHDVGADHRSLLPFALHSEHTAEVRRRTVWLHVCLPGQDEAEPHLGADYDYPTMDQLAHDLRDVLDAFDVRTCIGLGEGLGASALCRLGLYHPNRVLGLILVDVHARTATVDEFIRCKVANWREGGIKVAGKLRRYVRLGGKQQDEAGGSGNAVQKKSAGGINPDNLCKLLDSYLKRTDITKLISSDFKTEAMIVTGSKSPSVPASYALNRLNSRMSTLVIVDGVHDALRQAEWNVARAFILFCKGCGMLLSVPMLGLEKEFEAVKLKQQAQHEAGGERGGGQQQKRRVPPSESQMEIARAILHREYKHRGDVTNVDDQR